VIEEPGDVEHHLRAALVHRTDIGMAMGLLMERFSLDQAAAFAMLRRISQHENRKLHEIAAELVATRELPRSVFPEDR
jgi:AmiR/NasT family two-component response regulator